MSFEGPTLVFLTIIRERFRYGKNSVKFLLGRLACIGFCSTKRQKVLNILLASPVGALWGILQDNLVLSTGMIM